MDKDKLSTEINNIFHLDINKTLNGHIISEREFKIKKILKR